MLEHLKCRLLLDTYPDIEISVKSSTIRCFSDAMYIAEGIDVVDDLNDQFESMKRKLTDYDLNFIKVNNDSYLSTLILQRMVMQQEIKIEDAEELENYIYRNN